MSLPKKDKGTGVGGGQGCPESRPVLWGADVDAPQVALALLMPPLLREDHLHLTEKETWSLSKAHAYPLCSPELCLPETENSVPVDQGVWETFPL